MEAEAERIVQLSPLVPATQDQSSPYNYSSGSSPYDLESSAAASTTQPASNPYGLSNDRIELRGRVSTIPKGTLMLVKLDHPVSSFSSHVGDTVTGTLEGDIFIQDSVAIPSGSEVIGQVTNVNPSGRLGKHGEIEIRFNAVKTPDNRLIPLAAHVITKDESGVLKGNSYGHDILKGVGYAAGGTGVGAVLGTATGGLLGATGAGAVFGTAMGGIVGITYALTRTGKDVVLPMGSRLSVQTDQTVKVN